MISLIDTLYTRYALPILNRTDAQATHDQFIEALRDADQLPAGRWLAALGGRLLPDAPTSAGGVTLPHPLMLAAGLVKGDGFDTELDAMQAVAAGMNIIPGWRTLPLLVGPVEFGSFTRYPRLGNPGTVIWRIKGTQSTQNRIGLRNPGALAAAEFLSRHKADLPPVFGVNIAVSPGTNDPQQEQAEAIEAAQMFTERGVVPAWFTLNLSCPNTEDDPGGNQTEAKARDLCGALVDALGDVPLWVKVGPRLSDTQYAGLMAAFADVGVRAVIATNTLPAPTPDGSATAGIGGGELYKAAVGAVRALAGAKAQRGYPVDVVACGGVNAGKRYQLYQSLNVAAVQYYSATIYRSPLAAAIIYHEAHP